MSTINYEECIFKAFPNITDADFSVEEDETGLEIKWFNEATFGPKPSFESLLPVWLSVIKQKALAQVKELRQIGLDNAARSAGVLAVYNTNYEAAQYFMAGKGDTVLKTGKTSTEYLTGFGINLGMTAAQFANYIISENKRMGPSIYQVEKRYLALTYAGDTSLNILPINALTSEEAIIAAVNDFAVFCSY